mmetsp:Transcript_13988/g.26893  ORF Transcript_13988/g.26893 Transcript_13988/m.26893 type:complete len:278 (+) Transcript_13988:715-1548(+)
MPDAEPLLRCLLITKKAANNPDRASPTTPTTIGIMSFKFALLSSEPELSMVWSVCFCTFGVVMLVSVRNLSRAVSFSHSTGIPGPRRMISNPYVLLPSEIFVFSTWGPHPSFISISSSASLSAGVLYSSELKSFLPELASNTTGPSSLNLLLIFLEISQPSPTQSMSTEASGPSIDSKSVTFRTRLLPILGPTMAMYWPSFSPGKNVTFSFDSSPWFNASASIVISREELSGGSSRIRVCDPGGRTSVLVSLSCVLLVLPPSSSTTGVGLSSGTSAV